MADLPTPRDFEDYSAWTGRDVLASDGDRLGAVEMIFLDEATDVPEWVLVRLDDGDASAFVPLAGANVEDRAIRVEPDRERIAAAPKLDVEETLSVAEERRLYEHYGLAYSQEESSTVLPEGAGASGAGDTPAAPSTGERPRLRKYVGAPVPPPPPEGTAASGAQADATSDAQADAAPTPSPSDGPTTKGTGVTDPGPTPLPPPAPTPLPPEGGFQRGAVDEEQPSGPLAVFKRRPAIPAALAGAIAGLIAVLVVRRRR
jgi:hypothetical protein